MQTHYVRKNTRTIACSVRSTRAAALVATDDRVTFDADRAKGLACARCCGAVDKMDAIAEKHAARAQKPISDSPPRDHVPEPSFTRWGEAF